MELSIVCIKGIAKTEKPECDALFSQISVIHIGVAAKSLVGTGCHPPFSPPLQSGPTTSLVPVNICNEVGFSEPFPGVLHSSPPPRKDRRSQPSPCFEE